MNSCGKLSWRAGNASTKHVRSVADINGDSPSHHLLRTRAARTEMGAFVHLADTIIGSVHSTIARNDSLPTGRGASGHCAETLS